MLRFRDDIFGDYTEDNFHRCLVRFTPESRHWWRKNEQDSKSGHWASALSPKAVIFDLLDL